MCFSIALSKKAQQYRNRLLNTLSQTDAFESNYFINAFSFPKHPVITSENPEEINTFQWGLIPHWTKTKTDALKLRQYNLNARSETIFEKSSFKKSIQNKRCLVPVSGFFEWRSYSGKKYPYYIYLKQEDIFMLGGIYDNWVDKETGEIFNTFSILTTQANPMMSVIHNTKLRMPVILPPEKEMEWLNNNLTQEDINLNFIPFSEERMQAHTVSKLISSRKENPNTPEAIQPFLYPELEEKALF
jgi:putative SOS response-associated peptidase YedK